MLFATLFDLPRSDDVSGAPMPTGMAIGIDQK
jgi:hypothetical protein